MWCDGLRTEQTNPLASRKRKNAIVSSDESSEDEQGRANKKRKRNTAVKSREEKVEEVVNSLKEKHNKLYTPMQYRIWGEMVVGNLHSSIEEPPSTSMFMRAGGSTPKRKSGQSVNEALAFVADQISSVLSPSSSSVGGGSPAKVIDNRTKCYKQLAELNNLRSSGVLDESEYHREKESVMATLKCLQT